MSSTTITAMQQQAQRKTPAEINSMRPKDQIAYFLTQKKDDIAKMLPAHLNADRLLKVAQIAATTTPALLECDVPSLVGAIGQCAQMGLEPNTVLGHAYLVPFNTKRKDNNGGERWVKSVQVIIGYKGLIDLARRSGQIVSIAAHEVCENDKFELVYGIDEKLNHTPAMGARGEVVGFYAVAKLTGGGYAFEFMSRQQVEEIRGNSQAAMKDEWVGGKKTGKRIPKDGPWWDHFVEMGRKTVIRRLAKYLPLSIEFQRAVAIDSLAEAGKDQGMGIIDGDFQFLPDDAPSGQVDPETGEVGGQLSSSASVSMPQGTGRRDPAEFDDQGKQNSPASPQQEAGAAQTGTAAGPAGETSQQATQAEQQGGGDQEDGLSYAKVRDSLENAKDLDVLDVAADLITQVRNPAQQEELRTFYRERKEVLTTQPAATGTTTRRAKPQPTYTAE